MTVLNTSLSQTYVGNGAGTAYAITIAFSKPADIKVSTAAAGQTLIQLTNGIEYTIVGTNVILATALPNGNTLRIERTTPRTQETAFQSYGLFYPAVHEAAFDKQALIAQESDALAQSAAAAVAGINTTIGIVIAQERATSAAEIALVRAELGTAPGGAVDTRTVLATGTSSSRQLKDRFGEWFNVRDFGAVGDGVTDDYNAIFSAIIAANTAPTYKNKTVWFPPGTYRCASSLNLNNYNNVFLRGAGSSESTIRFSAVASCILFTTSSGQALGNGVTGLTLQAGGATRILTATSQTNFVVRDVVFVDESSTNYVDGLWCHSLINARFYDLYFTPGSYSSAGFRLATGVGNVSTNSVIRGSQLGTNDVFSGNGDIAVLGCNFQNRILRVQGQMTLAAGSPSLAAGSNLNILGLSYPGAYLRIAFAASMINTGYVFDYSLSALGKTAHCQNHSQSMADIYFANADGSAATPVGTNWVFDFELKSIYA